ncbi:hypothetical protein MASR1M32_33290 [Rhodobacter sp.]
MALQGKAALEALPAACASHDLVVIAEVVERPPAGNCQLIDLARLRQTGALALQIGPAGITVTAARDHPRRWAGKPMDPQALPQFR